jgi:septal ring factor EnvC (AmiA/AmiB activator)
MRNALAILALTACLTAFAPSFAQTSNDVDALTKKEQAAREKASALESERQKVRKDVSSLKKALAKTARQTQTIETDLTALERDTASLTARAVTLNTQIEADLTQYTELVAALQRLELSPPPTLALTPRDAKRAADAGLLMATLSGQLKKRADALGLNLIALEVTQAQLVSKKMDLSSTRAKLESEMKTVSAGLTSKSKLEAKLEDEKKTAAAEADRLAAESKTLLELIAKLEREAAKVVPRTKPGRKPSAKLVLPEGTKPFAQAKGGMIQPVSGRLIKSYGRGEKGHTYSGRAGGQVIAPYAGRVEFSGPFKNYDNVVILNVGDGYFVLLTGLNDLYIDAGDTVRRGEPVGKLPSQTGAELYIELRRNGSPVDPKPWLQSPDVNSG